MQSEPMCPGHHHFNKALYNLFNVMFKIRFDAYDCSPLTVAPDYNIISIHRYVQWNVYREMVDVN